MYGQYIKGIGTEKAKQGFVIIGGGDAVVTYHFIESGQGEWYLRRVKCLAAHLGHKAATLCCAIANRYLQNSDTNYQDIVKGLVKLSLDRLAI